MFHVKPSLRTTGSTPRSPHAAQTAVQVRAGRAGDLPAPPATRVLTVANQKGGVGKTTSTVNIAAALALHGLRVLVLDLDPQGNASTALGLPHAAGTPEHLRGPGRRACRWRRWSSPVDGIPGLFGAPATIDLAGAEIELVSLVARESRLRRALDAYTGPQGRFDYVFIDCPPSLGLLTVNAMVAADEVFIPIQCEYYALEGLGQLVRNVDLVRAHLNPGLHVSTILLTMYDARTRLAAQVADEVRRALRRARAQDRGAAFRPGQRGAQLRSDRHDVRPGVERGAVLPGGGPRARPAGPGRAGRRRGANVNVRRGGLGRGLGALIPSAPQAAGPIRVRPGRRGRPGRPGRRVCRTGARST